MIWYPLFILELLYDIDRVELSLQLEYVAFASEAIIDPIMCAW